MLLEITKERILSSEWQLGWREFNNGTIIETFLVDKETFGDFKITVPELDQLPLKGERFAERVEIEHTCTVAARVTERYRLIKFLKRLDKYELGKYLENRIAEMKPEMALDEKTYKEASERLNAAVQALRGFRYTHAYRKYLPTSPNRGVAKRKALCERATLEQEQKIAQECSDIVLGRIRKNEHFMNALKEKFWDRVKVVYREKHALGRLRSYKQRGYDVYPHMKDSLMHVEGYSERKESPHYSSLGYEDPMSLDIHSLLTKFVVENVQTE